MQKFKTLNGRDAVVLDLIVEVDVTRENEIMEEVEEGHGCWEWRRKEWVVEYYLCQDLATGNKFKIYWFGYDPLHEINWEKEPTWVYVE